MKTHLKILGITIAVAALMGCITQSANAQYMGCDSHDVVVKQDANAKVYADPFATKITNENNQNQCNAKDIDGVNTAGTVRVMNLSNFESMMNIGSNTAEMICIIWGATLLFSCFRKIDRAKKFHSAGLGVLAIIMGLNSPGCIGWVLSALRDANLFT